MITTLIIAGIVFIIGIMWMLMLIDTEANEIWVSTSYIITMLSVVVIGTMVYGIGIKKGQTDSLKGKYIYEMKVQYEQKDSVCIPVDTLFVKTK